MSRTDASPRYLGGIGLMLEVAHVCPRCGQRLRDSPSASTSHLMGRACKPTIFAALPEPDVNSSDEEEDLPLVPADRRIHDFEVHSARGGPEPAPSVARAAPGPVTTRSIAVPWLRPPDLGEVL